LIAEGGKLKITKTPNAENPLVHEGQVPLLTMDVWEHAYYLDFQNSRPNFMANFVEKLINWDFVAANFAAA
jgi:Fe-Mn family superoxide dismutase